jgi:trehalose 6-phosphate synthase
MGTDLMINDTENSRVPNCYSNLNYDFLANHRLIIASNRGPVTFEKDENGLFHYNRGSGGLITALTGLLQNVDSNWIACAMTEADAEWREGTVSMDEERDINISFLSPTNEEYDGYYNQIANPLLWFLQHSMWDVPRSPVITRKTWDAWENGYAAVNRLFAKRIIEQTKQSKRPVLLFLQDYHLYLTARTIYKSLSPIKRPIMSLFVHIPWPGPEYWGIIPQKMRHAILDGLCAIDMLGFQTKEDELNFIRTCQAYLPRAYGNFRQRRVWYRNHATHVRNFPISIDVDSLKSRAESATVKEYDAMFKEMIGNNQMILRVDRLEPSKNIIRGFQAFEELLEYHPEHIGKVQFLAIIAPSRMDVIEYKTYLDDIMAVVGQINAHYGTGAWEPIRLLVGEDYNRAVSALKHYDVLLVNSIADGMNLVAKEGSLVNKKNGVLILSDRTGASQQLRDGAKIISPCDVYETAEALHLGLTMPEEEKKEHADFLRKSIHQEDIHQWFCDQLQTIANLDIK